MISSALNNLVSSSSKLLQKTNDCKKYIKRVNFLNENKSKIVMVLTKTKETKIFVALKANN